MKRVHSYSIEEQEAMYPFERDFLVKMIQLEGLKDADIPEQGWRQYAKELGVTKRTGYQDKFTVLEETPSPMRRPAPLSNPPSR
jgi:hypothetical protein